VFLPNRWCFDSAISRGWHTYIAAPTFMTRWTSMMASKQVGSEVSGDTFGSFWASVASKNVSPPFEISNPSMSYCIICPIFSATDGDNRSVSLTISSISSPVAPSIIRFLFSHAATKA